MTETAAAPEKTVAGEESKPQTPPVPQKTKFFFKSRKEVQKQPDGTEKEVTLPKPETVELDLNSSMIDLPKLIAILQSNDEKQISLVLESVNSQILAQARSLVDEDPEKARKDGIDLTQLSWEFIANIPPATRRGGGIADEVWEAFILDYTGVMQHHGKTKEKAETGAKLLSRRFAPVKDQKKIIKALQENLMVWYTNTAKAEDFQQVYETLMSKADTLLARDEDALMAAI